MELLFSVDKFISIKMNIDYYLFIAKGEFGEFKFGEAWNKVINLLGDPPLYAPPGNETNARARYDDLEFAINHDNKIALVSLQLDGDDIKIPKGLTIEHFETPILNISQVEEIIRKHDVTWERMELMCDDWIDYFRTSTGVHLSFGGGLLGKVAACNPNTKWGT